MDTIRAQSVESTQFEAPVATGAQPSAWLISLIVHLSFLIVISFISFDAIGVREVLTLISHMEDLNEVPEKPLEQFVVNIPMPEIGADSLHGDDGSFSEAAELSETTEIPTPEFETSFEVGQIEFLTPVEQSMAPEQTHDRAIQGRVLGVRGTAGAIDQITQEILESLAVRETLVVWMFDQSGSLTRQRAEIVKRFERIYEELGVVAASGSSRFAKHEAPLLTSVVAFGKSVNFELKQPTDDLKAIKKAVNNIKVDDSGEEYVFTAIQQSINRFKKYRRMNSSDEPAKNVMFVVFTDEAGEDQNLLDQTVTMCRNVSIPVYVVGVPAPFGRDETEIKWVDPNPKFDQSPRWGRVTQGPESLMPERLKLHFSKRSKSPPLESGFGPYALTRLAIESNGIYFSAHANRKINERIRKRNVAEFASYLEYFFDPVVMRRYRPRYQSAAEYFREANRSSARMALLNAAKESEIAPMLSPRTTFIKTDEAVFVRELTEAQKAAASLEPRVDELLRILKGGESDRDQEASPRWQAGFDLAIGQAAAVWARTVSYNLKLAEAKRGMKFKGPDNNTWKLQPSDDLSQVKSQVADVATKAQTYLERVTKEHPETPWALLAQRELQTPLAWNWTESYTNLAPPPRERVVSVQDAPPPRDDVRRMLPKRKEKRPVPKL